MSLLAWAGIAAAALAAGAVYAALEAHAHFLAAEHDDASSADGGEE